MARKLRSGGSTSASSLDRTKKYKYNAAGTLTEFTGEPGDTDIVFSGSKSNLRRIADLERNISILAAQLKTTDGNATDGDDSSYPDKFTESVRFKSDTRFDDTMLVKTTIDATAGTVDAGTLKIASKTVTATGDELNILDGATVSAAELNILDGATVSTAELNILDGATLSTAELNYMDGVTSNVQTQINTKAPTANPTFTGTVSGVSASMVGLGNVTNESKATMFASPTFTGTVSGVSASHVGLGNVTNESKATMFTSPTFTGTTTAAAVTAAAVTTTGDVTVGGNLTVSGTTTTVNTETINLADNVILVNSNATGSPTEDGGIEVERGSSSNVSFVWNETNDQWTTSGQPLRSGHMLPETDVTYDLGSSSLAWRDLYLSGSTIKLGGATLSASGSNLALGGGGSFDLSANTTDNLAEGSTNEYYTNTKVRNHIEGQDLDMGTNKVLFSNVYATTGDLPSASSYHGMFAHVHGEGAAYFAHSGSWVQLAKQNQSPSLTLSGDVSGSATFTNLGSATLTATVANDSHSHSNYITSNANDTASGIYTFSNTTAATSATTGAVKISGGLGVGGAIYAAGDVTAYSDDRLKTNVHEIENGLDKVMALRGITFERIADGSISTGVSAQDVHAVLPEAVSTDEEGLMAVKYGNLVGLLIEAIKDLKEEVNELKGTGTVH